MAIPLPQVVPNTPEEGFLLSGEKHKNALAKQNLENQYYGPTAQANAMSKMAYAKYSYPMAIAQLLSTPGINQNIDSNQQRELVNTLQQGLKNPINFQPMMPSPRGDSALNHLINLLHPSSNEQQQNSVAPQMMQGDQVPQNAFMALPQGTSASPGSQVSTPQINQAAQAGPSIPTSSIGQLANETKVPGTQGGINPSTTAEGERSYINSQASAEGSDFASNWNKGRTKDLDNASLAQDTLDNMNSLENIYPKIPSSEKGTYAGLLPPRSEEAKKFDAVANKQVQASAGQMKENGIITSGDLDYVSTMKPSRRFGDESFNYSVGFMRGAAERAREKVKADNLGFSLKLTKHQTDQLWNEYIHDKPFWNPKTNSINEDNMNDFGHYFTKEKIEEIKNPRPEMYMKNAKKESQSSSQQVPGETANRKEGIGSGSRSIARDLQLPEFNSKEEFNAWYHRQPKVTQDAVKVKLGAK